MQENSKANVFILGFFIFLGLSSLGYLLANAAVKVKEYERSVTAKGLSEREYTADIIIWPIQFTAANNDLSQLYKLVDANSLKIKQFVLKKGIKEKEISFSSPVITDKSAQQYGNAKAEFRYAAMQTVTVYSEDIKRVREMMNSLSELGRSGIAFTGNNYQSQTKYIFTRLNEVKPEMIEEATKQARVVAQKFAADSQSKLGKIRKALQGQFSISARDQNNPHIKKVRVVSTVEYYLSD